MNNRLLIAVFAASSALAGCSSHAEDEVSIELGRLNSDVENEAPIESGRFITVYTSAISLRAWNPAQNVTADVDRTAETVVFATPDGRKMSFSITTLPKDQWRPDCAVMGGFVLSELAPISPAPVTLAGLTFPNPALYAKCGPDRLVLCNRDSIDSGDFVAFDRVR
ncbi:MAG: hypothetical protein QM820_39315 [Minicystis sp.]